MTEVAVDFLQKLRADGPWLLSAFDPNAPRGDGGVHLATSDPAAVGEFVARHDGHRNIYFSVNPFRPGLTKKAKKEDITSIEYLLADLDPNDDEAPADAKTRYLAALETCTPKPTAIIDSGNGIQSLWRLTAPITLPTERDETTKKVIADIEARMKAMMVALNSVAGTQNIDRILRLPGTTNLPTAAKIAKGRAACPTGLIHFNGATCAATDFPEPVAGSARMRSGERRQRRERTKEELPRELIIMLHLEGAQPAGYHSRSELLYAFIHKALRVPVDEEALIDACLSDQYSGKSIYDHVQQNGGAEYVKRQIEHALNDAPTIDDSQKQIIRTTESNLDFAWRQTMKALKLRKCPIFVRGGQLVQPLWRHEKSTDSNREVLICTFAIMNVPLLRDMIGHHAALFQKFDKRSDKWVNIDPPKKIVETIIDIRHWEFPTVRGIINAPTLRPDGTLLKDQGYDAATQLWYKPASDIELPTIADQPTRRDAEEALALLTDLLKGFPLKGKVDVVVALAAIMTVVLRGAFELAPMFLFTAPEPGSGKSYLVKLIAVIASGREASSFGVTQNSEEMEKRLSAAAIEGRAILNINNLTFDLESALLCTMITDGTLSIRPFGKNDQTLQCDCRGMTIIANGNNVRVVGDLVRRTLTANIDAQMERPETRKFDFDPVDKVKADRGKYLAAVFTIVRAYMAASPSVPDNAENLVGFSQWEKMVRWPLIWLGCADPVASTAEARALDPKREEFNNRMKALLEAIGVGNEFTAADVFKLSQELQPPPPDAPMGVGVNHRPRLRWPNLVQVFTKEGKDSRHVSAKSIGNQLVADKGRIAHGHRIELAKQDPKAANSYKLVAVASSAGPSTLEPR